eukprot:293924_1
MATVLKWFVMNLTLVTVMLIIFRIYVYNYERQRQCIPSRDINANIYRENGKGYINRNNNLTVFAQHKTTKPYATTPFELSKNIGLPITIYGKLKDDMTCESISYTRIEFFQACLNDTNDYISQTNREINDVYGNNDILDCAGSVYTNEYGEFSFDTYIPITYLHYPPHIHYIVKSKLSNECRDKLDDKRELMGVIILNDLQIHKNKQWFLWFCYILMGEECKWPIYHIWFDVNVGTLNMFGGEFVIRNTATDWIKSNAFYNNTTKRWMVEFDIVGQTVVGPSRFYGIAFSNKFPFVAILHDLEYQFHISRD